ncbi:PD-(D/E)XK nuclease family protein [Paludisphaera borealis]|nr:PD-(D/E)XK nuclease family protein [Paludisphaera borealis]
MDRLSKAHEVLKSLIGVLDPLNQSRPWSEHASALRLAAGTLGLGTRDGRALETLWDALEDRAEVLEKLGRGAETVSWSEFVDKLASVTAETLSPRSASTPGSIRTAVVEEVAGCRASHVLLVGLVEGSFPRRSAVQRFLELRPGDEPSPSARSAYARETLRFLQTLGSADRGVLLFYPTTDAKGQPLLRAGFLDDLLGALSSSAESACHRSYARFHPALLDREDLAVTPADVRVLASALAGEEGRLAKLRSLAGDPAHRIVLEGAAAALSALERRRRGTPYSEFEGLISDPAAVASIARSFSPETHTFSPSQLETYLSCPFQFFSRHVLHLKPIEERDELAEDYTERGSRLHDILEEFEKRKAEAVDERSDEQLLVAAIDKVLSRELVELSELDLGLRELEYGQIQRIINQYARQRSAYESDAPSSPVPQWFEFGFGDPDTDHPDFKLSLGAEIVKLRGRIDRIDRIETEAGPKFRVIDYKSGTPPSSKEVADGRMLQLPLYAMAVEKLLFESGDVGLLDVGYWGLKDKGYKPIVFQEWEEVRHTLVERVFHVIGQLRSGEFVVDPRKDGCETYCEYRGVCRIRQVRAAAKSRDVGPTVSAETTVAGRKPRTPRKTKKTTDET